MWAARRRVLEDPAAQAERQAQTIITQQETTRIIQSTGEYQRREDPATGRSVVVAGTYAAVAHPDNPMILFRYAAFLERTGALQKAEQLRAKARGELPGVERREMRELRRRR